MFFHNFKYTLKTLFKNKSLIFWTFAFPLILGTFFSLAFSDIEKNESLEVFPIALVKLEKSDTIEIMKNAFESLSVGEERLFDLEITSLETAKASLEKNKIVGFIELSSMPKITVSKSGVEETVLKTVTETIVEEIELANHLWEEKMGNFSNTSWNENVEILMQNIQKEIENSLKIEANIKDVSPTHLSYTMIEFYSLIAMTCLYGGLLTMVSINKCLANMCSTGKRVSVTPTRKYNLIFSSVLASFLVQLLGLSLLFLYTIVILHIDYGTKMFFIFLLSIVGSFAGVTLGCFIATLVKSNENMKTGILLAITMTGSFFSGMMGITMKYLIDKNIAILNRVNPVNMITDGLYALYYYETNTKFYFNVISLLLFSFVMILCSLRGLRRQRYDSI